jgi:hypothetical protein
MLAGTCAARARAEPVESARCPNIEKYATSKSASKALLPTANVSEEHFFCIFGSMRMPGCLLTFEKSCCKAFCSEQKTKFFRNKVGKRDLGSELLCLSQDEQTNGRRAVRKNLELHIRLPKLQERYVMVICSLAARATRSRSADSASKSSAATLTANLSRLLASTNLSVLPDT